MILLQNPNMPVPTNAVEIDAAILDIKAHLETGLTWLTNGYGRTYKNLDARNGTTVFYPEAYLGEQNNSQRYINLSPDNDKQGQCFFYVVKETISQFQPGMYSYLSYDTAIIFSVNMELINDALLQTEIFQQILVAQVRDVLTRDLLGSSYQLSISSVDFLFENVYSEFDLADAQQLEKAPLSHFRFNCTIKLPEQCPTPAIVPPILTCYSLDLDGVNEYIEAPINAAYDLDRSNLMSFEAWVKFDSLDSFNHIFSKYDSVAFRGFIFNVANNELRFALQNFGGVNGLIISSSGASITVGSWHHLMVTYDGSSNPSGVKLYQNGILLANLPPVADTLSATIINAETVKTGAIPSVGGFIDAKVNQVRWWNVELTAGEVLSQFNSGTVLSTPVQSASLIYNSANGNGATFNGSEWEIPDLTGITAGYESVNMEIGDRVEDCPS